MSIAESTVHCTRTENAINKNQFHGTCNSCRALEVRTLSCSVLSRGVTAMDICRFPGSTRILGGKDGGETKDLDDIALVWHSSWHGCYQVK